MMILLGILIPFIGTAAGAACILFMRHELKPLLQKSLLGFAAGVMVAASVWICQSIWEDLHLFRQQSDSFWELVFCCCLTISFPIFMLEVRSLRVPEVR